MAILTDEARTELWAEWMRENLDPCSFTKAELRAAVNAIDQWISDNQTTINAVFPVAFRTQATPSQKAAVMAFVLDKRYNTGTN